MLPTFQSALPYPIQHEIWNSPISKANPKLHPSIPLFASRLPHDPTPGAGIVFAYHRHSDQPLTNLLRPLLVPSQPSRHCPEKRQRAKLVDCKTTTRWQPKRRKTQKKAQKREGTDRARIRTEDLTDTVRYDTRFELQQVAVQ